MVTCRCCPGHKCLPKSGTKWQVWEAFGATPPYLEMTSNNAIRDSGHRRGPQIAPHDYHKTCGNQRHTDTAPLRATKRPCQIAPVKRGINRRLCHGTPHGWSRPP